MSTGPLLARLRERDDVPANIRLLPGAAEPSLAMVAAQVDEPDVRPGQPAA